MIRFVRACLLICLVPASAMAQSSPGFCKTKGDGNGGVDTRFLGIPFQLIVFSLAEKHCGAEPKPMRELFLGHLEKNGCGSGTEVYSETEATIKKLEYADLAQLAQGVEEGRAFSEQQATEWAVATVGALGGCDTLLKQHDAGIGLSP